MRQRVKPRYGERLGGGAQARVAKNARRNLPKAFWRVVFFLLIVALVLIFAYASTLHAQVIVVDKNGNFSTENSQNVDRRYAQVQPTKVELPTGALDARGRQDLLRYLMAEQGFAMRPFPRGHKGLELVANGKLKPAGEAYVAMITSQGVAANPGERLVISDVRVEGAKIVLDLNGGPDPKHRILRHISIGVGEAGPMGGSPDRPVVQGDEQSANGTRLTLQFEGHVPNLTADQVKDLLAPLISFGLKTPIQAYTDTLPPQLREAILNHHVMVGMSTQMVLYALGEPMKKSREVEDQMPFEEWIYGQPPQDVQFVRINGNRVIRVEIAKVGYPPKIFNRDEVTGLMRTDGTQLDAPEAKEKSAQVGDVHRDPNTQSPAPAPSLAKPGEKVDEPDGVEQSKPVRFPKQDNPDSVPDSTPLPKNELLPAL